MRKITAGIFFLIAALLYITDRICLRMTTIALANAGVFQDVGNIDSIITIILAVIFAFLGVYMLMKNKDK